MRIVSLIPSGTEILCALGLEDCLVGISHECDFPEQVQHLPRVTYSFLDEALSPRDIDAAVAAAGLAQKPLYGLHAELLQSLAPDLILTQGVRGLRSDTRHGDRESGVYSCGLAASVRLWSHSMEAPLPRYWKTSFVWVRVWVPRLERNRSWRHCSLHGHRAGERSRPRIAMLSGPTPYGLQATGCRNRWPPPVERIFLVRPDSQAVGFP